MVTSDDDYGDDDDDDDDSLLGPLRTHDCTTTQSHSLPHVRVTVSTVDLSCGFLHSECRIMVSYKSC